ncbi:hypothetical protein J4455_00395 [Candidatus Woesearchaeota archaeon]|nr:hypothetical protein [Candidatus Woesearchaeota archaeon]
MVWYKVICRETHYGSGHSQDQIIYVWDKSTIGALNKYKKFGWVPRNRLPSITPLDLEDGKLLEGKIKETSLGIRRAKNTFFRAYGIFGDNQF